MNDRTKSPIVAAWLLVIGAALFRVVFAGLFPLVADETNYWQWGRHLDWSYHDNAPMIGWTIRLATELLGNTEIAVRLPSILAMAVASLYMVAIAGRWINPRAAFYTALLSQGILEFNVGGLMATTDGLQALGWAGASYHVARAYDTNHWRQWLTGGFWFGFGLLSKYTMVVFLPGAFLFGLLSPDHRKPLAGVRPYIGLVLGGLMFLPVIAWNAAHGWNSARHVAYIGGADQSFQIHFKYLAEYLGGQAGLLSPIVFILVLLAWHIVFWTRQRPEWIYRYLFWTSFPMFAGFALLSLHTRVYANWPGAAYITAIVLAAGLFTGKPDEPTPLHRFQRTGRRLRPWATGTAYFLTALLLLHVATPILPVSKKLDRVAREIAGWEELGEKVGAMVAAMPHPRKTFIFGLRYQTASELAFYVPGQPKTVSINRWNRPNVYDYWWQDDDVMGWDAVGVTYAPTDHLSKLDQVFERVDPPVKVNVYRDVPYLAIASPEPAQVFYIYRAYGFKGGMRWLPPNTSDIRAGNQ